jgi:hypothetical protein
MVEMMGGGIGSGGGAQWRLWVAHGGYGGGDGQKWKWEERVNGNGKEKEWAISKYAYVRRLPRHQRTQMYRVRLCFPKPMNVYYVRRFLKLTSII